MSNPCKACSAELPEGLKFCKECDSWQGERCIVCKHRLPMDAKLCNGCDTYQEGWRSVFPFSATVLALLTALIAVISPAVTAALFLLDRPSNTRFKVSGADDKRIYVKVWNTGKQPSTLVGYHLRLGGQFPIPDVDLDLSNDDSKDGKNVVSSASPVTLALVPTDPTWLPKHDQPEGYTSDEFKRFENNEIALVIDIQESRTFPKLWRFPKKADYFPIRRIRAFLCGECRDAK